MPHLHMPTPMHMRPLAGPGFISYRYPSRYGWVMIGAKDHDDALRQANRSLDSDSKVSIFRLEIWNETAQRYVAVTP